MDSSNLTCRQCKVCSPSDATSSYIYLHNSCFHVSLKAIQGLTSLRTWLKDDGQHRDVCSGTCLICSMGKLFDGMELTNPSIIDYDNMCQICRDFTLHWCDAYVFLQCLLKSMSKEFVERFPINQYFSSRICSPRELFSISLTTSLICLSCRRESNAYSDTQILELDIDESTTIGDALNRHFNPKIIDHTCESCKKLVKAKNRLSFSKRPNVATFLGTTNQVVNIKTQFSLEVSLSQYWIDGVSEDVKYHLKSMIVKEQRGDHIAILFRNRPISNYCLQGGTTYMAIYELSTITDTNCSINPKAINAEIAPPLLFSYCGKNKVVDWKDATNSTVEEGNTMITSYATIGDQDDDSVDVHFSEDSTILSDAKMNNNNLPFECPNDVLDIVPSSVYLEKMACFFQSADASNDDIDGLTQLCDKLENSYTHFISKANNIPKLSSTQSDPFDNDYSQVSLTEDDYSSDSSDDCSFDSYKSFTHKVDVVSESVLTRKDPLDNYESTDEYIDDKTKKHMSIAKHIRSLRF